MISNLQVTNSNPVKVISWIDIIFGVLVMPGMMFLFPIGEWGQWHSNYVLLYILWLYFLLILTRTVLGPLLLDKKRGRITVACSLLIIITLTFLMSLTPVDFPRNPEYGTGMAPHIRAMWLTLITVLSYGLPVGMLSAQVNRLSEIKEADDAVQEAETAVRARREDVISDEDLQVKSSYKTIHVPIGAIQYVEGRNNYACFHLDHREDVVTQMPLKNVLEALPQDKFVRIHRSYIVPVWRIEKRTATSVKLLGVDKPLPVGRSHKKNLDNGE